MRRSPSLLAIVSLVFACAIASLSDARASTSLALSLEDLATNATAVVRVTELDHASAWKDGRIVTRHRLRVERVVAGTPPKGEELLIDTLGGIVGAVGQLVEGEPRFAANVSSLIFIAPRDEVFRVVGRGQGQLPLVRDGVGREVVRLVPLGNLIAQKSMATSVTALEGRAATDASQLVARAWETTHAR